MAPISLPSSPARQIATEESLDSDNRDFLSEEMNHSTTAEEIWSGNKSLATTVESVDTSVPASGAVWQLPSTEPVLNTEAADGEQPLSASGPPNGHHTRCSGHPQHPQEHPNVT